ncbi:hypothetical protein KUL72_20865 [Bradyrhizobium arachidis]|uniref:hypothetical protein n=1 Tax=Bradyrhizobium arachidis TaxID=858423 RepID=UPI002161EC10|nr:hypothetical protein [Bradyrhizobium arachidis]UVO33967.1 hypothetical protein KUL72_20865 [Bradyrhizobium arachidis]
MKDPDNDNDTWISIGLPALRVLESCEQKKSGGERNAANEESERDKTADHRKAVEHGIRQIERFENRYRRSDRS